MVLEGATLGWRVLWKGLRVKRCVLCRIGWTLMDTDGKKLFGVDRLDFGWVTVNCKKKRMLFVVAVWNEWVPSHVQLL